MVNKRDRKQLINLGYHNLEPEEIKERMRRTVRGASDTNKLDKRTEKSDAWDGVIESNRSVSSDISRDKGLIMIGIETLKWALLRLIKR